MQIGSENLTMISKESGNDPDSLETYAPSSQKSRSLTENSSLQDLVTALLNENEKTLDRMTLLFFYTSDPGKSKKASKQYANSQSALSFFSGTNSQPELNTSLALHFGFDIFTIDVGSKDEAHFSELGYKNVPLVIVTNKDGKIMSQVGGQGQVMTIFKLYQTLIQGMEENNINLKEKVIAQNNLLRDMVSKEKLMKNLQSSIDKTSLESSRKRLETRLENFKKKLERLKEKEKELWQSLAMSN